MVIYNYFIYLLQSENYTPLLQYAPISFLRPFLYSLSYVVPFVFYLYNNLPQLLPFMVVAQFVTIEEVNSYVLFQASASV